LKGVEMSGEVAIQTHQLTKRYGSLTAVKGLDLEVRQGEVFGFLGPNGAGKTTSINIMCGLLKPDKGWVRINDKPLSSREARTMVGVCPQQVVLWERLTCREQLEFIGQMYGLKRQTASQRGDPGWAGISRHPPERGAPEAQHTGGCVYPADGEKIARLTRARGGSS
jgi:ABC-2 type transport system ATP-binding protein